MDRYGRCPHCGHPSPPPSPGILLDDNGLPLTGVGSHSLQAHRISPPVSATSTIQSYTGATLPLPDWNSWDAVQMDAEKTLESQELVEPEPELSADLYRTLWDLLGLTIITVISLILWSFISPEALPWFLGSVAFFGCVWTGYHLFRGLFREGVTRQQRIDTLYTMHMYAAGATCIWVLAWWLFARPWQKPWFVFVFAGSSVLLVIHYALAYLDFRRLWLMPQLQLYLTTVLTCFAGNMFWDDMAYAAWWLWPTGIWGILIMIQVIIWTAITKRRIRLHNVEPVPVQRPNKAKTIQRPPIRATPADTPPLVDFNDPLAEQDAVLLPEHRPRFTKGRVSPPPKKPTRQAQEDTLFSSLVAPKVLPNLPPSTKLPLQMPIPMSSGPVFVPVDTTAYDGSDFDDSSTPLIEYVSTPPVTQARLSAKLKSPMPQSKPISLRVIHRDDSNVDVVEGSAASPDGITIDVVHITQADKHFMGKS